MINSSTWSLAIGFALISFFATVLATKFVLPFLKSWAIIDVPNNRSSHAVPTHRGGGLAIVPVIFVLLLVAWAVFSDLTLGKFALLAGAVTLAIIGFMDDRRDQSRTLRFSIQFIAVVAGLVILEGPVFQGLLPTWLDHSITVITWLWMINAVNFMDGIDGITISELGVIGAGLAVLGLLQPTASLSLTMAGVILAGAMAGFAVFNWHPARVFMGDVGSLPLGYLTGGFLLWSASRGDWLPALLLPLYYAADATLTIIRRAARREP
ncbi:MAG: glycosyltransferase family 4 protein, partial [Pseudomonadota bacterium]